MKETPLQIDGINDSLYAGFWIRLGSILLDFLFLIPITILILYINNLQLHFYFFTIIPSLLFGFWYNVYLVQKYGGTPCKLISGIKIIKLNGENIEWKEAILRYIILFGIILFSIYIMICSINVADSSSY